MTPIEKLLSIMAQLRDPKTGCPWDKEQNFTTIAPHTLEEAYEVIDAIERNDFTALKEELGDLLLQIVFYAQMATEEEKFTFDDIVQGLNDKLTRRHPHVFGDTQIKTAAQQEAAWEHIKEQERKGKKDKKNTKNESILANIPHALPALLRAEKLQKTAANVGFDWPTAEGAAYKMEEESIELHQAIAEGDINHITEEIGDMLFSVCNLARKLNIRPEDALRACNKKFEQRFRYIEEQLSRHNLSLQTATLKEMDLLWDEAKTKLSSPGEH